jgi:hypothetical protein
MWKNKHVVVAMLVAPVLAVLAWYGVDYMVAERAQVAQPGETYPLVARSNCRYESGACDLVNSDFKLTVRPVKLLPEETELQLESPFKLAQATLALVQGDSEFVGTAIAGEASGTDTLLSVTIPAFADPAATLRIAVTVNESVYFAEVPVVFMRP